MKMANLRLAQMSSATLQTEERRLLAARSSAARAMKAQVCGRLNEKLSRLREEIARRRKRGECWP
jgi:hypothetical protein